MERAIGIYNAPRLQTRLLPFERQLIAQLGCTEDEYIEFKRQVELLSRERPAEYDGVPEINAEAVTIVLAVVGILLQAVSYFLTPKPNVPQQREISNRNLDSIAGRDRFAPTYGFQAAQELSRYGETIPIVFTEQKRVQLTTGGRTDWYYVGGIMVSPKLVWSQTLSWGNYQSLNLMFLLGQSPVGRGPYSTAEEIAADRAGIYIGQTPLDSFDVGDYRWYYRGGPLPLSDGTGYEVNSSRLLGRSNRYGTFGPSETLDENAFKAQTFAGLTGEAFCHTFSPSNQTRFGAYNALPNGASYRLPFEPISYLNSAAKSTRQAAIAKRFQIAGNPLMAGTGRNYARQFGIVEHNGTQYAASTVDNGTRVEVAKGDTITLVYNAGRIQDNLYYKTDNAYIVYSNIGGLGSQNYWAPDEEVVDNKQIRSSIQTEHEQQDEALKIGSKWLIGNCMYKVIARSPSDKVYDKTDEETVFTVTMECIAVYDGPGYVGVCDYGFITSDTNLPEDDFGPIYNINSSWFPICKADFAIVQNARKCEATEIGIKSNVWTRLNGITNFQSVPSAEKIYEYDLKDVSLTAGTTQAYARRASFFNLYIRPADNTFEADQGWIKLNRYPLCVVGSSPQDQYNYIRIGHDYNQYEYLLRPITSGEITRIIGKTTEIDFGGNIVSGPCIRLNGEGYTDASSTAVYTDANIVTDYGTFTLSVAGFIDSMKTLSILSEFVGNPSTGDTPGVLTGPLETVQFLGAYAFQFSRDATTREVSNAISNTIQKDPDKVSTNIPYYAIAVGGEYTFDETEAGLFTYSDGSRSVSLTMRLRADELGAVVQGGRSVYWTIINHEAIDASFTGDWQAGETFALSISNFAGYVVELYFQVNEPNRINLSAEVTGERIFENNSGIVEVSYYGNSVSHSCDNGPEHEVVYINENLANDPVRNGVASYEGCAMAGLKIRGSNNIQSFEQLHLYSKTGLQVTKLRRTSDGNVLYTTGPSSVFTDLAYYLLTNAQTGAGELVSSDLIDTQQFARTGSFLEANNLYFDDVIVEPQNIREFLARISASLLCNLVMRNGRFSIEPALPIDEQSYSFYDVPVTIKGLFTEGNIIEDSFQLEYIPAQERLPIRALVRYRTEFPNRFPQEQTTVVYYNDQSNGPIEEFGFTHITSRYHAELLAKFILSSRRHRTHVVSFKTMPYGLGFAPGDFIRIVTQAGYTSVTATGIIDATGLITCTTELTNGQVLDVYYWDKTTNTATEGSITVTLNAAGLPTTTSLLNTVFSVRSTTTQAQVYVVDSIQLNEDGLAEITASNFPVDENNYSVIANELKPSYNGFTTVVDLAPDQ